MFFRNYNVVKDVVKDVSKDVTDNAAENVTDILDKKLSRAERLIEIVKILSEKPEKTVVELSDRLLVVERTIKLSGKWYNIVKC